MGTTDVRLDPRLNVQLWSRGVQGVSTRLRVRISRKRKEIASQCCHSKAVIGNIINKNTKIFTLKRWILGRYIS